MQDEINGRLYQRPELVQQYAKVTLTLPEVAILLRQRDQVLGQRVLDIGCGAGRLAAYLGPSSDYVGLDISPHMVAHCRERFPGQTFVEGDLRVLPFEDASFNAVIAIANVIDAVSHEDRVHALEDWRRVLAPGGVLVMSTHNRHHAVERPVLGHSRNPITQLRMGVEYLQARLNHARLRRHERAFADYELRNDPGHEFSVLHYYIERPTQERQLADAGFEVLDVVDETGRSLPVGADDRAFTSLHYVARKAWTH
jgi:SAM-dependent methyltransferase